MTEYYVPTAFGESEYVEKRSCFLGYLMPVESEEEARAFIEEIKRKHHDARHNCWCYLLNGGPERYSDDGEPQGTAGIPMLEMFRREGVTNLVCVVTRYFGGILLGTGGLLRAYTKAAKDALDQAGISVVRTWQECMLPCPYAAFERYKNEIAAADGVVIDTIYADRITLRILLPEGKVDAFATRLRDLSSGSAELAVLGEKHMAAPIG